MNDDDGYRRFGVVLFDNPEDPGPGWIAVGGDKSAAARISGPHDLSTEVIWWTNLTYQNFFRGSSEIWRNPWLRHEKYLVVGPADVMKEWGHDPKVAGADFMVKFVAEAFSRIMTIAFNLVRKTDPKLRMDRFFEGKSLRDDLRRLIPEAEYPKNEAAAMMKSGQAFDEFTTTAVRPPRGSKLIRLRKPRVTYCWEILQTPFPLGPWEMVERGDLRRRHADRMRYVVENAKPVMAEVAISNMQPEVAPIYNFGAAIEKDKRVQRSWVAQPEFVMLSRFANIEVRSAWEGREYAPLMPNLPEAVKDFLMSKFSDVSWSAGVVAETLWRAAALPEEKGRAGTKDSGDRAHTSWRGAWIKAADKSAMFLEALRLTELGHLVTSYGIGWLFCAVAEEDVKVLIRDASSLGLLPQISDVPEGLIQGDQMLPWGGEKKATMMVVGVHSRHRNFLWNLDKIATMPDEQRKLMLTKLLEANKAGRI